MFWGYLHQNQTVQIKRWFGDTRDYIEDCQNNPFVLKVVSPFEAENRDEALTIITARLNHE